VLEGEPKAKLKPSRRREIIKMGPKSMKYRPKKKKNQ
jgi:hypothetical protein